MGGIASAFGKIAGGLGKGAEFLHRLKVLKGLKSYAAKARMMKTWDRTDLGAIWKKQGLKGVIKFEFKELIKEKIVDLGTNIGMNVYNSVFGKNKEINKLTDGLFKSATSKNLQNQNKNKVSKKRDLSNYNRAINNSQNAIKRAQAIQNDLNTALDTSARNELLARITGMNMARNEIKHLLETTEDVENEPVKQGGLNGIILLLELRNQLRYAKTVGKTLEIKARIAEIKGSINTMKRTSVIMGSALAISNSASNDLISTVRKRNVIGGSDGVFMTSPLAEEYDNDFFKDAMEMMKLYCECKVARTLLNVYTSFKNSKPKEDQELEDQVADLCGVNMLAAGKATLDLSGEGAQEFLEKTFPILLTFKSKVAGFIEKIYLKIQQSDFNKNHPIIGGIILDNIIPFLADIVLNPLAIFDGILPPMPTGFTAPQLADWFWKLAGWGLDLALTLNPYTKGLALVLALTGFDLRLNSKMSFLTQLELALEGSVRNVTQFINTVTTMITGMNRTDGELAEAKYLGTRFSSTERDLYEAIKQAEYVMHNYGYSGSRKLTLSDGDTRSTDDGPLSLLIKGTIMGGPDIMVNGNFEDSVTYRTNDADRSLRQSLYVYKHDYIKTLTPYELESGGIENFYGTQEEREYEAALTRVAAIMTKADYTVFSNGNITKDLMDRYSICVDDLNELKAKWKKRWTPEYIKSLVDRGKGVGTKPPTPNVPFVNKHPVGSPSTSLPTNPNIKGKSTKGTLTEKQNQIVQFPSPIMRNFSIDDNSGYQIQSQESKKSESNSTESGGDINNTNPNPSSITNMYHISGGSETGITNNYHYR
jgi:hypothetical protein